MSSRSLRRGAGLTMMAVGGNTADGAIATERGSRRHAPHLCGMGGDLFALVHDGAPGAGGAERVRARRLRCRPGAAAGPSTRPCRSRRHPQRHCAGLRRRLAGPARALRSLPLADVLAPAIALRRRGFPASPMLVGIAGGCRPEAPPTTTAPCSRRASGHAPGAGGRCAPSRPTGEPASTAASSAPGCSALGIG